MLMDFSDIEKTDKAAFDFLVANKSQSESVKNVSISDAPQLIDALEQLHRYLSRLENIVQSYAEDISNLDISSVSANLRDFSKRINLDIEFLKRKT